MNTNRIFLIAVLLIMLSVLVYAEENSVSSPQQGGTTQGIEEKKDMKVEDEKEGEKNVDEVKQKQGAEETKPEEKEIGQGAVIKAKEDENTNTVLSQESSVSTKDVTTEKSEETQKVKKEFFTGSTISFGNSFGINPDNPLSTLSLRFLPKYNPWFTNFFYVSGRIDISKEVTNSDSTTYQHETQLSDARLEFVFPEIYRETYTDIVLLGFLRTTFPTSKVSQYATLRWGNAVDLGISKGFFGEKGKAETQKLFLGYDFRFYKNWHKYTTSEIQENSGGYYKNYPLRVREPDYLNTGNTNLEYQIAHIFSTSIILTDRLSFIGYFWVINGWAYEPYSGGKRGRRDSIDFNVEVDYQVFKWMTVAFGIDTFQPQLLPNSTYTNNPFWRNTYDNLTTLYFDVSFAL